MKTIEEVRKELLICKEILEQNLESLNRLEVEEQTVTLRIGYGTEREEEITIPQSKLCTLDNGALHIIERTHKDHIAATRRKWGPLAAKALYLNDSYDWELGRDDEGALCLVPIKREIEQK